MTLWLAVASLVLTAEPPAFGPVSFETGKATLTPESDQVLEQVKAWLDATPEVSLLRVEVHSDSRGAEAFNQRLTEARAAAVATALVKKGVSCRRLVAVGFGSTRPVAPNDTTEGRARNRRTVFVPAGPGDPLGGGVAGKVLVCL